MSLRLTTDHRVFQHLTAFALAWVAASLLFLYVLRPLQPTQPEPGYHMSTLGKGETAVANLLYLSGALRSGNSIVILGSSELATSFSHHFIPYIFFPRHHLSKVITLGSTGFESLGMYGLLYSLKPHLNPNTRLVILMSPDWFRTKDLWPQVFNEDFNDNVLLQLYLDEDPRSVFHDYLTTHQFEFTNLTYAQEIFLDDSQSMIDWRLPGFIAQIVNARAYSQREKLQLNLAMMARPNDDGSYHAGNAGDLPWADYEKTAAAQEAAHMTNNDLWVRNHFYDMYMSAHAYSNRHYFPPRMNPEPEMNGFRELLQLLKSSKVKPLFVLWPLNPRMYDDLSRFDPVEARIVNLCKEYGMKCVDMYPLPYEKGVLRDGVHPGELGWERADREISEYYKL